MPFHILQQMSRRFPISCNKSSTIIRRQGCDASIADRDLSTIRAVYFCQSAATSSWTASKSSSFATPFLRSNIDLFHQTGNQNCRSSSLTMASTLASIAARRAANLPWIASSSGSCSQTASLLQRRGLSSAADHHGPAKVNFWHDPMSPSKWKEEHFVIVSLTGWGLFLTAGYKFFTGGNKNKEGTLVEAAQ